MCKAFERERPLRKHVRACQDSRHLRKTKGVGVTRLSTEIVVRAGLEKQTILRTKDSKAAYRKAKVILWDIPRSSPDLNPVEKFWGWLRKELQVRDRADLAAKRAPLSKAEFRTRVRAICRSKRAQKVAKKFAKGLRKVCVEVVAKQGAASNN